jgi:hypothetical protein
MRTDVKANISVLEERKASISQCQGDGKGICCEKESVSGAVSQRPVFTAEQELCLIL